jgi:16S rRNA (guanine1207-N2)-methyltransferase
MKRLFANLPYEQPVDLQIQLWDRWIEVLSKPGIADWNQATPAQVLIARHTSIDPKQRLFYLGCGHGVAAAYLAITIPGAEIWVHDDHFIALEMTKKTLLKNNVRNFRVMDQIELEASREGTFAAVVIDLPKGRRLAERWLLQAWKALIPGGSLFLAGANSLGIQPAIDDAEQIFGPGTILGYKKGNRIARFSKGNEPGTLPGWAEQPGISPHTWNKVNFSLNGQDFELCSLPGVFSFDRLDPGTRILLENMQITNGAQILDVGCGYGVIGIVCSLSGAAQVDMVDSNLLAVAAARKNVEMLGLDNARVNPSDVLSALQGKQYDLILTNPPFHAGKGVDYQIAKAFIEQSHRQLLSNGQFILVANEFIRYDELMIPLFKTVRQHLWGNGYKIWHGLK